VKRKNVKIIEFSLNLKKIFFFYKESYFMLNFTLKLDGDGKFRLVDINKKYLDCELN
jgi:hypothetical protein